MLGVGNGMWSSISSDDWRRNWNNWSDMGNMEVSIACLGFNVGNSVGVFAGGDLRGVEWDTVGSDDWDVLWSNPFVVSGVGDWGGDVGGKWGSGVSAVGNDWSDQWGSNWKSVVWSNFVDFVTVLVENGTTTMIG
jgi:hypothetical protein